MTAHAKSKITFLIGFAAYFSAIWFLWDTPAVYPLKVFVVLLHEISHAMIAVATGGTIDRIVLDPNQGGACYCPGGNAFLTLSAGYLGSLAWGGLLVSAGQVKRINSRWVTGAVGLLVIGLTLAYVRSPFGFWFGLAFGSVLVLGAARLSAAAVRRACNHHRAIITGQSSPCRQSPPGGHQNVFWPRRSEKTSAKFRKCKTKHRTSKIEKYNNRKKLILN